MSMDVIAAYVVLVNMPRSSKFGFLDDGVISPEFDRVASLL